MKIGRKSIYNFGKNIRSSRGIKGILSFHTTPTTQKRARSEFLVLLHVYSLPPQNFTETLPSKFKGTYSVNTRKHTGRKD